MVFRCVWKYVKVGDEMDNIKQFYELTELEEKNIWFVDFVENNDIEMMESDSISNLLDVCFKLFKENFEKSKYDSYEYVADICECLLNKYIHMISLSNMNEKDVVADFIIDIVCYIYELTYKYEGEVDVLKKIVNIESISPHIRVRALDNMIAIAKGTTLMDEIEFQKYLILMKELS